MLPQRMCAVCRTRRDKAELLRIVKNTDGRICVDEIGKLQGRGAYICRDGDCVKNAVRRHALERSFSCSVDREVYKELEELSESGND